MGRHVESGTKASFDHKCCVGGNIHLWFCQETLSEALRLGQTGKPQKVPSWNKIEDKKVGNTREGETVIATSMATTAAAATASATPKTTGVVKVAC